MDSVVILGIDPGLDRMGWCVLVSKGVRPSVVKSGCILTTELPFTQRLLHIKNTLMNIVKEFHPDEAGVETLFFSRNTSSAMRVAEARGVIMATLEEAGIAASEYNPANIKLAVTGNGQATKKDVERMVKLLTKSEQLPKLDDEVDAIAIALCHAASRSLASKTQT